MRNSGKGQGKSGGGQISGSLICRLDGAGFWQVGGMSGRAQKRIQV